MYLRNFGSNFTTPEIYQLNNEIISNLEKAINGEYSAIHCYEKLAQIAPTEEVKMQILEIREDERRHLSAFITTFTNITGQQPSPQLTEDCKETYREGLVTSFIDEQENVDFYLDMADKIQDPMIKEMFKRAAADEQNHAGWFSYFLMTNEKATITRQNAGNFGAKGALNATSLHLVQMLTYALQDEFLAQSRYNDILLNFGYIRTFARIQEAELRHIRLLLPLFDRYQVEVPEDNSKEFITTPATVKEAYAIGVEGEIENIDMYNKFMSLEIPADVRAVFTQLRDASLNHLTAFERGLQRK
ncbi:ferritin family protein [Oceanobacillus halophilus]|uniref:DUF2202 domain-containing protein n=1 Tax=Oceanobacillus halophilus TaxID=930130 RepID=A0A494ZVN5_9BACI|nr:ferritin family protein [Oceanobacillus halophilus]RKQ30412.1 DUF2202 domain-containing protein [Oceanobacillus halophilus]